MLPKNYSTKEHSIHPKLIDKDALKIIEKLRKHHHNAFAVGGCVRDLLLGVKPKDYDISTSAKPEEIKKIFPNCILIGRRFRLAHIRFGHKVIEVSTFRAGDNSADELITQDNVWGSEEEDALRRDFTINGLFYEPHNNEIIDYVDGFGDIEKKVLKTIGDPASRFRQDPVRMIRLLKFLARFDLKVEKETDIALKENIQEILKSSPDRIVGEVFKMLDTKASEAFFKLMAHYSFMDILFPKIGSFLKKDKSKKIYNLLKAADSQSIRTLEKPVLFSCLIYPIVAEEIQTNYVDKGLTLHLGEIFAITHDIVKESLFEPFPRFPRWIRKSISFIVLNQYRFTPLTHNKKLKKTRLFSDKNFNLALKFFWLRAHVDESCVDPYAKIKRLFSTAQKKKTLIKNKKNETKKSIILRMSQSLLP